MQPWQMWGSDAQVIVDNFALGGGIVSTPQLARADYGRPETWSFLFSAYLQESVGGDGAPTNNYSIRFDLLLGSGRSTVSLPAFCQMVILPSLAGPDTGRRWTTSVVATPINDLATDPGPLIESFPAQSINCVARLQSDGGLVPMRGTVVVSAYFAPKAHVRPEWFRNREQFRGGEDNGL